MIVLSLTQIVECKLMYVSRTRIDPCFGLLLKENVEQRTAHSVLAPTSHSAAPAEKFSLAATDTLSYV